MAETLSSEQEPEPEIISPEEKIWKTSENSREMFESLQHRPLSDRELRLFAVACGYYYVRDAEDERFVKMFEVAEKFADNNATLEELQEARSALPGYVRTPPYYSSIGQESSLEAARYSMSDMISSASVKARDIWLESNQVENDDDITSNAERLNFRNAEEEAVENERKNQADLLRDIFGNPFRKVEIDPRWQSSTVLDVARTIYDEKTFETMPILGDALMDAGCDNEEIIKHCQSDCQHVRGCWVLDLLLGK